MFNNIKFLNSYKGISINSCVICINITPITIESYITNFSENLQIDKKYFVEEICYVNGCAYISIEGKLQHSERFITLNEWRITKLKTIFDV